MKNLKFILIAAIALLLGTMPAQAADGVIISQTKATVNIGDTLDLTVAGTDKIPTWTSYNANIAKVDKFGEVTALRKGKTTIRARAGSIYKTCVVTVVDSSIKLNKTAATIYHGGTSTGTVQLKATVKGASKAVTWESLNPDVAAVDANGKVTSVSEGTATVVASANGKSASCTITVKESSISLNMENLHVSTKGAGSSIKVTPTVVGSKKTVKWTTSDRTVATVSGGRVTGKKTGTATITATANGVSASCNVTVTEGLVSINEEKVLLYVGGTKADTKQLKTNAAKTDMITWSSSNPDVASVDAKGLVTPVSDGTAVISVECGGKTDTCEVTVRQTATSIAEDSVLLKTKGADKTYVLNKQVVGKTTGIKWATSDKAVATVSNGKVTAKKAGTATITATANGVSDTVVVNVADYDPTIKLNQQRYTLYTGKGNAVTLKATADGPSKTVTWASSDTSVATVNKGKVTAVGAGTAVITATANGVTAECIVNVMESAVVLDRDSISLDKGEKETIGYDIIGTSQSVKWATTNSKIATVKNGTITAKAYGEADIKVTANGVTAICHVNVTNCQHQYDDGIVTVKPACGTEGSRTFTCILCGDAYTEVIPATGEHNYEWVVTKEPTCTEEGLQSHICTVCGCSDGSSVINAAGHDFGEWTIVKEATDKEEGLKERTCRRCGETETASIPASGHEHDYAAINTVAPTCTEDGYTEYQCTSCKDYYKGDIIAAIGHSYADNVIEPTCEMQGCTEHICTRCSDSYIDSITDALGHEAGDWITIREPSCDFPGRQEKYCIRCDIFMEQNSTDALGHDYDWAITKEPTCTESGEEQYKCSKCGDFTQTREIPAAHTWGEWETAKEPADGAHTTIGDFGTRKHSCTACSEAQEESIINIDMGGGETKQIYGVFFDDMAYETLALVNDLRASVGAGELRWFDKYSDIAHIRAAELDVLYGHVRPNGDRASYMTESGIAIKLGENIWGGDNVTSAKIAVDGWATSEGHYSNMVNNDYEDYYCGCFASYDSNGNPWYEWVQLFWGNKKTETTAAITSVSEESTADKETSASNEAIEEPEGEAVSIPSTI